MSKVERYQDQQCGDAAGKGAISVVGQGGVPEPLAHEKEDRGWWQEKMPRSPFRYPGGKSKKAARESILQRFPTEFREFREAFVGGGGIFFAIPTTRRRWINDMNADLVATYRALRDSLDEFIEKCRALPSAPTGTVSRRTVTEAQKNEFRDILSYVLSERSVDPAVRFFVRNRLGFSGKVVTGQDAMCNPEGWNIFERDILSSASGILRNTKITCGSYERLLSEPGNSVVVYCDPPYMSDTLRARGAKLYAHTFTEEDHERLVHAIRQSPHRVVLSYDDDPAIRALYSDFHIHEASWTHCDQIGKRVQGRELVITNFPAGEGAPAGLEHVA